MSENSSKHPMKKRIGLAALAIVWVVLSYALGTIAVILTVSLMTSLGVSLQAMSTNVLNFILTGATWMFTILILIIPFRKQLHTPKFREEIGLTRLPSWSDIGLALVAYVPYLILSVVLGSIVVALLPGFNPAETQDVGFSEISSRFELFLAFFALVIAAPIIEEIIFRGYLFSRLRREFGMITGVVITSVVFGIVHLQLNVGIDVFALSILLCILRIVTGSIWAGVILHMAKNALAFFLLFVFPMIQ